MSKIRFSEEQIKRLKDHPCIENISDKSITYTMEFREKSIDLYQRGYSSRQIFEEAGLSVKDLGMNRIRLSLERWRKMSKRDEGFKDTRKGSSGRPRQKPRTPEEELKYLKDRNEYLEQENEFLKKLDVLERSVRYNSTHKKNTK